MTRTRLLALWIGAAALILIVFALQLIAPGDTIQTTGANNATIQFSGDHRMVAAPGMCLVVRWQVDQIQAVYVNGTPSIGEGSANVCVTETDMPSLRVDFKDGTIATYSLTVNFLSEQVSTWLLIGVLILLGLFCLVLAISRPRATAAPSASGGRAASRVMSIFAAIGVGFLIIVLTLVVLELGMRFYFNHFGTQQELIDYIYTRDQIEANGAMNTVLPFVGTVLAPGYPGHNSLGYRGEDIQVPKPKGIYRIVVMGDSTTYDLYMGPDQTYAANLQQILRADGYSNVEVVNGGATGYTTWNILVNLAFRVPVLQPNLVIFYEATNDVAAREVPPECYSDPGPALGLDPRYQLAIVMEEPSPFALYRFIAIKFGWMQEPQPTEIEPAPGTGPCYAQDDSQRAADLAANPPTYFERNIREIAALEQSSGVQMMFMSWAYDHSDPQSLPYWSKAVDELNAITAQVAKDTGSLFFDYAAVAPVTDGSYWAGFMHMNAKGTLSQAQAIAKFLLDQNVIPKPEDSGS